jgi:hypothetical protein
MIRIVVRAWPLVVPIALTSCRNDSVAPALLVIPIAEAKAQPGAIVAVEGVVTVGQGTFRTQGDNAYIQDPTGGVQLFDLDPALGLVVGDSIGIAGRMGAFSGEQEIVEIDASTPPTVVILGTGTVPAPRSVTVADILARTFEGQLGVTADARLLAAPSAGTTAYTLTFADVTDNMFQVRIDAGVVPSVPRTGFWTAGARYNLTGVLSSFIPPGTTTSVPQLKPRDASDIETIVLITTAKRNIGGVVLIEGARRSWRAL